MPRHQDKPSTRRNRQLLHLPLAHLGASRLRDMGILALLAALLLLVGCAPGAGTIIVVQTATPGALGDATANPTASGSPAGTVPIGSATTTPKPGSGSGASSAPTHTPTPKSSTPSLHQVSKTTTLYGGDTGPATVSCPTGELALGGGWSVSAQTVQVLATYLDGNTWKVSAQPLGHTSSHDVTAYIEYLRNAPGAVVTRRQESTYLDRGSNQWYSTTTCAANELLAGWGFALNSANVRVVRTNAATTAHPPTWEFYFQTQQTSDPKPTFYAECLSHVNGAMVIAVSETIQVENGMTGSAQVSCAAGDVVAGDFAISKSTGIDQGSRVYETWATSNGWQASLYALGSVPMQFAVGVLCLKFS